MDETPIHSVVTEDVSHGNVSSEDQSKRLTLERKSENLNPLRTHYLRIRTIPSPRCQHYVLPTIYVLLHADYTDA